MIDLWCLFDFIQPGSLGGLNQFGREYQRPIEAGTERDSGALERLRGLIQPLTLRRTKQDVAKDLPAKLVDKACRQLSMHALQRNLYLSEVASYSQKQQMQELLEQKESGMLGVVTPAQAGMRSSVSRCGVQCQISGCGITHRAAVAARKRLKASSAQAMATRSLYLASCAIFSASCSTPSTSVLASKATVINGDTSTSSQSAQSRQKLIDQFQQ